jgi:predicted extracellular nuclease
MKSRIPLLGAFCACVMLVGGASAAGSGSVSLTTIGVAATENFDTLATTLTTNTALPTGWFLSESGTSARNNDAYAASTGSDNAGDVYSFGVSGNPERAFGALRSGTLSPIIGAQFTNNTGEAIAQISVAYTGEQWRLGTSGRGPDNLDFQVSTDATSLTTGTWTDANALDLFSPFTVGAVGALDGNAAANRTSLSATVPLAVAAGATFWIRWTDFDASNADDGLAVDDFSLTPLTQDVAPSVTTTSPTNGATGVAATDNVSVSFSEPVNATGSSFDISCANSGAHTASVSGGPTTFTVDPDVNFGFGETCAVTVLAANVTDQDTNDPPDNMAGNYVFSFTTAEAFACGDPATPIHAVQGNDATSPIVGNSVQIEGVVTGDYQASGQFSGFFVQEEDADVDADPATSEGIFVFNTSNPVSVGDNVRLRGTVTEFNSSGTFLTELTSVNGFALCSTGNSVTTTNVTLPVAALSDFETYEGMLVHFPQTLTANETFTLSRFGEVRLAADGRLYNPTAVVAPGAPAAAQANLNQRRSFVLDDGNNQQNIDPTIHPVGGLSASNTLRSGYTTDNLTGILEQRFSVYRLQPAGPVPFTPANPRTAAPDPVGGNLRVASFNVLNFFNGNGTHQEGAAGGFPTSRGANTLTEFNRQLAKEVSALTGLNADIVGLMELENDGTPNSAIEDLVNALNAAIAPGTYAFIDTGIVGTDEIRVALIYKPASVTPVGSYAILNSSVDPRFIDTLNRPALAQTFELNSNGRRLTVVVNHLKSKGSDCIAVGDPDTGDGQGNCNLTRKAAAEAEVDWLATDPTGSGSPDYLVIGDMNSYTFEDPITAFTNAGYHNLIRDFHGLTAYSFVFNGEAGYLDHALASPSLAAKVTGATDWHINADEPIALDYNVEFKSANQVNTFYDPGPYRASDHDPVIVGISLNAPPTVSAGGPYTVDEGSTVTVSAAGSDSDGDTLTFAWDLNNDGIYETPGQSAPFDASAIDGPDSRIVNVRATDPGGDAGFDTTTVTVNNARPGATFNAPATAFAGIPFTISLTNPTDPAPADTFEYAFACGPDYGAFGAASSATCTATATGPLTVRGKIMDDDGGVTEYTAVVTVGVTFDSLCDLTRLYVTKTDVENALCEKLDTAEAAATSGDAKAKANALNAYVKQIKAQTGKSLTAAQAQILIALARQL